jgi:hypothetical protein
MKDKWTPVATYYEWAVVRTPPGGIPYIESDGDESLISGSRSEAVRRLVQLRQSRTPSENRKMGRLRLALLKVQEVQ